MDERDSSGDEFSRAEQPTEPNASGALLRASLRSLGEHVAALGRNLAQVEDALDGLSPSARRVCFEELERIARDVGEVGHLTARTLHDARMEL